MAIKKGICKNYGECDIADTKPPVIQEADSTEFVCKECGLPLYECTGGGDGGGLWKKIALGVAGTAILGGGAYFLLSGNNTGTDTDTNSETSTTVAAEVKDVSLSRTSNELIEGTRDTLQATVNPEGCTATLKWASSNPSVVTVSDGIVTAVAPGTAKIGVQVTENKELTAFCEYTVKKAESGKTRKDESVIQSNGNGTLDMGYGIYTGSIKNGKPHGMGRLVYRQTTVINRTDNKQRKAQSGESIQGQFVNGTFTIGKHFDINGHLIESLNFGVAN